MQEGGTALRNMGVKVPGSRRRQDSVGRDLAQCDGFNNNPISQAGGSRLGAGGRKMLTLGAASPGLPLALDHCCLVSGPVSSPPPHLPRPWLLLVAVLHLPLILGEGLWLSPSLSFETFAYDVFPVNQDRGIGVGMSQRFQNRI